MDKKKVLKELKKQLPRNPHVFRRFNLKTCGFVDPLERWEAMGCPYLWRVAQEFEDIVLLDDIGYGWLALVVGNKVVCLGENFVSFLERGIVGLGPYYGFKESKLFINVDKIRKEKK